MAKKDQIKGASQQKLPDTLAAAHAELLTLRSELAIAEKVNEELQALVDAKPKVVITGKPQVKVGGVTYNIVIPSAKFKGRQVTAADIVAEPALAKELVEAKSGMLKKVS